VTGATGGGLGFGGAGGVSGTTGFSGSTASGSGLGGSYPMGQNGSRSADAQTAASRKKETL
jgi:hypothetical protein